MLKILRKSTSMQHQDFIVVDAEKLRDENPVSFSIPRSEQRKSLRVGDSAKIILESKIGTTPYSSERLWVLVKEVSDHFYKVKVDNNPVLFPDLADAILTVRPEHIISIILPDQYILPFGKTCYVSESVLTNKKWPAQLLRIKTKEESDSGWRIFAENENSNAATSILLCDELISRYQVLDTVMDEPSFLHWIWDESLNEFVLSSDLSLNSVTSVSSQ